MDTLVKQDIQQSQKHLKPGAFLKMRLRQKFTEKINEPILKDLNEKKEFLEEKLKKTVDKDRAQTERVSKHKRVASTPNLNLASGIMTRKSSGSTAVTPTRKVRGQSKMTDKEIFMRIEEFYFRKELKSMRSRRQKDF